MIETEDPEQQRIFTILTAINSNEVVVPVLLDTGTPITRFPPAIVNAFAEAFGLTEYSDTPGFFDAPCSLASQTPGLTFTFTDFADADNQVTITMPWSEAVIPLDDDSCLFAFAADEEDAEFYVMGQTFLQSTYLYVNLEELTIGLGQANWD